jgi:hypothetical protein
MATRKDSEFNRREKSELRNLSGEAWAEELSEALLELYEDFGKWAEDSLSPFDLNDKIHEFHNGKSRELYVRYSSRPEIEVARAIAKGYISEGEVSESLLEKLRSSIEFFAEDE